MNDEEILWQIYREARKRNPQEGVAITVSWTHLRSILDPFARRAHIDWLIYSNNRRLTMLDRAFPSCPGHPGKYELKVVRDDGAFHYHVFASIYPARKMYDLLVGDRRARWETRTSQRCENLTITSKHLERIVTHEYTPEETVWLLPMPYTYYARNIAFNEAHTGTPTGDVKNSGISHAASSPEASLGSTSRSRRAEKRAARRASIPNDASDAPKAVVANRKAQPGVEYGIPQLAERLGWDPSKVRGYLRKHHTKPQEGWVWTQDAYNQLVKEIIAQS